jgi:hypothetical protein
MAGGCKRGARAPRRVEDRKRSKREAQETPMRHLVRCLPTLCGVGCLPELDARSWGGAVGETAVRSRWTSGRVGGDGHALFYYSGMVITTVLRGERKNLYEIGRGRFQIVQSERPEAVGILKASIRPSGYSSGSLRWPASVSPGKMIVARRCASAATCG